MNTYIRCERAATPRYSGTKYMDTNLAGACTYITMGEQICRKRKLSQFFVGYYVSNGQNEIFFQDKKTTRTHSGGASKTGRYQGGLCLPRWSARRACQWAWGLLGRGTQFCQGDLGKTDLFCSASLLRRVKLSGNAKQHFDLDFDAVISQDCGPGVCDEAGAKNSCMQPPSSPQSPQFDFVSEFEQ